MARLLQSVETEGYKSMVLHVERAFAKCGIAAIKGNPGVGKSHLALTFYESRRGCILVTPAKDKIKSYPEFMRLIWNAYQGDLYHMQHKGADYIRRELDNNLHADHDFLIIDEAQRIDLPLIRSAMAFSDSPSGPRIPVIFLSNYEFLGPQQSSLFGIEQILSRVEDEMMYVPNVTLRDFQNVAMSNGVTGVDALNMINALHINYPNLRKLTNLLEAAREIIPEGPIEINLLKLAAKTMPGFTLSKR